MVTRLLKCEVDSYNCKHITTLTQAKPPELIFSLDQDELDRDHFTCQYLQTKRNKLLNNIYSNYYLSFGLYDTFQLSSFNLRKDRVF